MVAHEMKNDRGAEAYAAFASVIRTAMKTAPHRCVNSLHELFGRPTKPSP
jgi:hypothetical protein